MRPRTLEDQIRRILLPPRRRTIRTLPPKLPTPPVIQPRARKKKRKR